MNDYGLAHRNLTHHDTVALDARHFAADRRQRALEPQVRFVLVAQATLEPPAHAGELRRIEREVLLLGHLDRDRVEFPQPRRAAKLAATRADRAHELGFVAGADLLHLDPHAQLLGDVTHQ